MLIQTSSPGGHALFTWAGRLLRAWEEGGEEEMEIFSLQLIWAGGQRGGGEGPSLLPAYTCMPYKHPMARHFIGWLCCMPTGHHHRHFFGFFPFFLLLPALPSSAYSRASSACLYTPATWRTWLSSSTSCLLSVHFLSCLCVFRYSHHVSV